MQRMDCQREEEKKEGKIEKEKLERKEQQNEGEEKMMMT